MSINIVLKFQFKLYTAYSSILDLHFNTLKILTLRALTERRSMSLWPPWNLHRINSVNLTLWKDWLVCFSHCPKSISVQFDFIFFSACKLFAKNCFRSSHHDMIALSINLYLTYIWTSGVSAKIKNW